MGELLLPVVIHDDVMSRIYNHFQGKKNYTGITYGIYAFLYNTTRRQNNIRVYATDTFIKKGTGVGDRILLLVKKVLQEIGLIEIIHSHKEDGTFTKKYIEVKFVWKPESLDKLFYQEQNETTEYKIARELLVNNFEPYDEIESRMGHEFETEINGRTEYLSAVNFYFNEDEILVARAGFNGEDDSIDYTVPTPLVGDVIIDLANNYKFSFDAVLNTLNSSKIN